LCFLLGVFGLEAPARVGMTDWTYDLLKAKATLIVIATPTKVTVLNEQGNIPWLDESGQVQTFSNVMRKEVETTFSVLTVLKGEQTTNTFVLHSFEYAPRPGGGPVYTDSDPHLVAFDLKEKKSYLLFLRRQNDGRYIPVSGHYDASFAIKEVGESFWLFRSNR